MMSPEALNKLVSLAYFATGILVGILFVLGVIADYLRAIVKQGRSRER